MGWSIKASPSRCHVVPTPRTGDSRLRLAPLLQPGAQRGFRALEVPVCCYLAAKLCLTLLQLYRLQPSGLLCPRNFPGKNSGVGSHFLLQGIFPTQGSNPGLQDCRRILYQLSQPGSLKKRYGEEINHQPKGITEIPLFNLETIKLKNMQFYCTCLEILSGISHRFLQRDKLKFQSNQYH